MKVELITKIIGLITAAISSLGSIYKIKPLFYKRKYLTFKEIRKEYLEDKINGYFYFQSYIGLPIPTKQIDFILNSEKAFSIMKIIKTAYGKYDFKNGKFYSRLRKKQYLLPGILYVISALCIFMPIVFCEEIIKLIKGYDYIYLMIFIICIFGPILINSIQRIIEISSTIYLETLTKNNKI